MAPRSPGTAEGAPRVSIVLPTYNRLGFLRRSIESVMRQSFMDWELVIVDDASTDGTKEFLDDLAKQDPRVRVIHHASNESPDISANLNEGMDAARGIYIARLDDDDYWIDDAKLEKQTAFLDAHPNCMVVGGGVIIVDAEGRELSRYFKQESDEDIRKNALFSSPFSHTTVMFRKDVAQSVGGYGYAKYAEDWDLWLKLGTKGTLYNFPEYFAAYTMSGENKSFLHLRPQTQAIFGFLFKHRKEYPGFLGALTLNTLQWCYSLIPASIRRAVHPTLAALKRRSF